MIKFLFSCPSSNPFPRFTGRGRGGVGLPAGFWPFSFSRDIFDRLKFKRIDLQPKIQILSTSIWLMFLTIILKDCDLLLDNCITFF